MTTIDIFAAVLVYVQFPVELGLRASRLGSITAEVRVVVRGMTLCWVCWVCGAAGYQGGGTRSFTLLSASTLCRVDGEVALDAGSRRHIGATLWTVSYFIIYVGASCICSPVLMASSLSGFGGRSSRSRQSGVLCWP